MNTIALSWQIALISSFFCAVGSVCLAGGTGQGRSFAEDVALLRQHQDVIVLRDEDDLARIAIVPGYQGRVMTSTNAGGDAPGFGWVNEEAVRQGPVAPHINLFGGEDRFWLAPEGGQFGIYFKAGDPFDLEHWQTPPLIDAVAYRVVKQTPRSVSFEHRDQVTNYSGTRFDVQINRRIELLDREALQEAFNVPIPAEVRAVAYRSQNKLSNRGDRSWTKESGLLSIWILGMLKSSPTATVAVPYRRGTETNLGPVVNDNYFGRVPADRLVADSERAVLYFKGDGLHRAKIGLLPQRSKQVLASYDPQLQRLTIVRYTQPPGATDYANSMWELQDNPYGGDAINSYNDGGEDGTGTFYELETASPAEELAPGESVSHTHQTVHLTGPQAKLDAVARQVLGVDLERVAAAFR